MQQRFVEELIAQLQDTSHQYTAKLRVSLESRDTLRAQLAAADLAVEREQAAVDATDEVLAKARLYLERISVAAHELTSDVELDADGRQTSGEMPPAPDTMAALIKAYLSTRDEASLSDITQHVQQARAWKAGSVSAALTDMIRDGAVVRMRTATYQASRKAVE